MLIRHAGKIRLARLFGVATLLVATAPAAQAAAAGVSVERTDDALVAWSDDCEGTRNTDVIDGIVLVTRTEPFDEALEVSYTVGGDATPGLEYEALPGIVTIAAGEASAEIVVTPIPFNDGFGQVVEITITEGPDVVAAGDPTARVGLTEVSGAGFCHKVGVGVLIVPDLWDPIECDVHGNTTFLPTEPRSGFLELHREDHHGDLVVGWEIVDPDGARGPLVGQVTLLDGELRATTTLPKMEAGQLGIFRLVRDPYVYGFLGDVEEEFEVVHGPIVGAFCVGPYEYGDRTWTLEVGAELPHEPFAIDSGNIRTGTEVFRLASGTLPPGMTVDPEQGVVGSPTEPGNFSFAVANCQVDGLEEACTSSSYDVTVLGVSLLPDTGQDVGLRLAVSLLLLVGGWGLLAEAARRERRGRMLARLLA